jgi:hypothetical protein
LARFTDIDKECMDMKKILFCLLTLMACINLHAAEKEPTALFVCTGDTKEYIDNKSPTVQATSVNLSIIFEPDLARARAQLDKTWGCIGTDDLCKKFTMLEKNEKFSFIRSESDSDFNSQVKVLVDFSGETSKFITEFIRTLKPPPKDKKPPVAWSTQKITSDLKCEGVEEF